METYAMATVVPEVLFPERVPELPELRALQQVIKRYGCIRCDGVGCKTTMVCQYFKQ